MQPKSDPEAIRDLVREGYGRLARGTNPGAMLPTLSAPETASAPASGGCCAPSGGCATSPADPEALARSLGYTREELAQLPEGVNLGLSCGNPTALAALKEGEVVLDLGSGAGFDIFVASKKVGPRGRAIGVDMTPDMVRRARANIASWKARSGFDNVEFRLGEIEHLPIADRSIDVLISNCVINLSPDKPQVWREIARVLKPGGRVAVSDIALFEPLPAAVVKMVDALVGCVAGAALVHETDRMAMEAGLVDIVLTPKNDYLREMSRVEDPLYREIAQLLPPGKTPADYVTSLSVTARKAMR